MWCTTPRFNWFLEAGVPLAALVLLAATYRRFPLTNLLYALIALEMAVMLVGARTTYEQEPLFAWLRDSFGGSRNHFDRVGHFMQGVAPAMVTRELLRRVCGMRPGKFLFYLCVASAMGISAAWEILEWQVCVWLAPEGTDAWLGGQGDVFDTQKDMFLCLLGALIAMTLCGRAHERALRAMGFVGQKPTTGLDE